MPRKLTERAAWLLLANTCERAVAKKCNAFRAPSCRYNCFGLCPALHALNLEPHIEQNMEDKINSLPRIDMGSFRFPNTIEGCSQRAKFCRAQAAKLSRKKVRR